MSFKSLVMSRIIAIITDQERRDKRVAKFETKRKHAGSSHEVIFFHDILDPYSHILLLILPDVFIGADIKLTCHLVSEPKDDVVPEREMLSGYAIEDAKILAKKAGIECKFTPPEIEQANNARSALAKAFVDSDIATARDISIALWSGKNVSASDFDWKQAQINGTEQLYKLGHYMGVCCIMVVNGTGA